MAKFSFKLEQTQKNSTTASGHVDKGEIVEEASARELKEETGLTCNMYKAQMIKLVTWKMDKKKSDGSVWKARAKSCFYIIPYEGNYEDFKFDPNEVLGLVLIDAKSTLELFKKNLDEIDAIVIKENNGQITKESRKIKLEEFLLFENENAEDKYGHVLEKIIEATKK